MQTSMQEHIKPVSQTVTYGQVEAALKALPVNLLPEVYEYLHNLVEDAADLAMFDARQNEPTRPVEEFFAELDAEETAQASPSI